jgi:hypothetical protein
MTRDDITEKNRRAIEQIRRTPMPISDLIPLLIESNDEIEKLKAELDKLDSRCTELLFEIKMIHGA